MHDSVGSDVYISPLRIVAPSVAIRRQLQAFHSSDYVHFLETHGNQSDSEEDEEEVEDRDSYGLGSFRQTWNLLSYIYMTCLRVC